MTVHIKSFCDLLESLGKPRNQRKMAPAYSNELDQAVHGSQSHRPGAISLSSMTPVSSSFHVPKFLTRFSEITSSRQTSLPSNRNVKFKNFMQNQEREEKFLKGSVGDQIRLRFWNMHQTIDLVFMQLARYTCTHTGVLEYQSSLSKILTNK